MATKKSAKKSAKKPNAKRAPKSNTSITLDAVALLVSLVLFLKEQGVEESLTNIYRDAQSSPEYLTNLPQNDALKQEIFYRLQATFGEAAKLAALAPAIHKYLREDSAEQDVNFCYLIVRLLRKGIARPSPQANAAIWKDAWRMADKKKLVKEKRSLLIKNHLMIDDWKHRVQTSAERKFLRMVRQVEGVETKAKPIQRKLESLFPKMPRTQTS